MSGSDEADDAEMKVDDEEVSNKKPAKLPKLTSLDGLKEKPKTANMSFVWDHYLLSPDHSTHAVCKRCKEWISAAGSTSAMTKHLRTRHCISAPARTARGMDAFE
jgi:hypothetical protein